jgi:4-amino-4-deoxy-L-arabinose transferase-like glycosyltransferase
MVSILLSTGCVPLLYGLGRTTYGRTAGLVAATCFALSPFHIWLSQSPRPNALVEFFVLVSLLALLKAVRHGRGIWWVAVLLTNLLLVWAYPQTLFFIAAEIAFVLVVALLRRQLGLSLAWVCIQVLLAASPVLWLKSTLPYMPERQDDFMLTLPTVKQIVVDGLGDDAVLQSDPFAFPGTAWPWLPQTARQALIAAHEKLDLALMLCFAAAAAWGCMRLIRAWTRPGTDAAREEAGATGLFLLSAFLPFLLLLAVSVLWRPGILARYTHYTSLALYLLAGGAVAGLQRALDRRVAVGVLIALFGYQLAVALPGATRADWLGAARHISDAVSPEDVILVKGTYLAADVFRYNAGNPQTPVMIAPTLQAIAEKSARFLREASADPDRAVWALIEPFIYTLPPLKSFEEALDTRGLAFTRTDFPSMNGLFLYRIVRDPAKPIGVPPRDIETHVDYAGILDDMHPGPAVDQDRALAVLRDAVDTEFPRTRYYYSQLALYLANEGCLDIAEAAARRAVELGPGFPFAHFALAVALGEKGEAQPAIAALESAIACDTNRYFRLYQPLFEVLYEHPDPEASRQQFQTLDAMGVFLPQALRVRAGTLPAAPPLRLCP